MNIKTSFISFFESKSLNIDEFLTRMVKECKPALVYRIFSENFISFYSSQLKQFFDNITSSKILYCERCINNPSSSLKDCITNHNIQNIPFSFDSLFQFFESVIKKEQLIKEKLRLSINRRLRKFALSEEIAFKQIANISTLFKLRLFILLEKFKSEKNINDPNIVLSHNIKFIIHSLSLSGVYNDIISSFIKDEINYNLQIYSNVHNKQILHQLIEIFTNYYLEWAYLNSNSDSDHISSEAAKRDYIDKYLTYIKQQFMKIKVEKFFDIISSFPESTPTLSDIKYCLPSYNQGLFVKNVKRQISSRLQTPGISTRLIIEIFIRIIKIMKAIEPSSYLLEMVSSPIKEYLRKRKDTMQWLVTTILSEEDANIMEDMSKAYVRNIKSMDYDFLSSDEEPESWEPVHTQGLRAEPLGNDFTNKMTDIISTLVNIFGSPEKFMEQYKRMLSERAITDTNFSLENEIKNIELLKLKFGENLLQNCEIIIKDIKDSIKLNTHDIKDDLVSCLVINKNYWPFLNNSMFDINNISPKVNALTRVPDSQYDKFLLEMKERLDNYKKGFTRKKFSRNLNFYSNVGFVNLTLSFTNGEFNFLVSLLSAFIIKMFDSKNKGRFHTFTPEYISDTLKAEVDDVKKKINFWVTKGVLKEQNLERGEGKYYEPNDTFKNLENNELIVEEDIYSFEYSVQSSNWKLIENSIVSIIKNSGPKNFEQLYKNLSISYQLEISEIKLKDLLGKMTLDQKIFKEGENYKLILVN